MSKSGISGRFQDRSDSLCKAHAGHSLCGLWNGLPLRSADRLFLLWCGPPAGLQYRTPQLPYQRRSKICPYRSERRPVQKPVLPAVQHFFLTSGLVQSEPCEQRVRTPLPYDIDDFPIGSFLYIGHGPVFPDFDSQKIVLVLYIDSQHIVKSVDFSG